MSFTEAQWKAARGGYLVPYDARPVLERLAAKPDDESAWDEVWMHLHHQGDVGEASYMAVVELASQAARASRRDWHLYNFASTVELERHRKSNPALPKWLGADYHTAVRRLFELAADDILDARDYLMRRSALSMLAIGSGELKLGAMVSSMDSSDIDEWVERRAWSELYDERR